VLENNINWFINTQVAFFSASMIIIGSFVGYKNLVTNQVESGNQGKNVLEEYEDKYQFYEEFDYKWYVADFKDLNKGLIWNKEKPKNFYVLRKIELITDDMPDKAKIKKLPWYKAFFLSFKGGFNLLRIFGYIVLILGFMWLNKIDKFDFASYFFGLTLVPALALIYLWIEKKSEN
jgi:pilus assembly protein TadC